MVFALIPFLSGDAARDKAIRLSIARNCEHSKIALYPYPRDNPSAYFFASNSDTSKSLAEKIMRYTLQASLLPDEKQEEKIRGVIVPVSYYYGYADRELWEWIDLHSRDL